jgi:hypothetical protein
MDTLFRLLNNDKSSELAGSAALSLLVINPPGLADELRKTLEDGHAEREDNRLQEMADFLEIYRSAKNNMQ